MKTEIHIPCLEMSTQVKLAKAYYVCPENAAEKQIQEEMLFPFWDLYKNLSCCKLIS